MSVAAGIATTASMQQLAVQARWRERELPVDLRVRPWYNPDLRTANFIIPGLLAIILTFTLISFTAASIVRERELGTLEQLQVTPITRTELILGKILPFLVIGYVQLTIVVLMMTFVFGIPIAGSLVALYLLSGIFIASVLGLGIFISTVAQTQMQPFLAGRPVLEADLHRRDRDARAVDDRFVLRLRRGRLGRCQRDAQPVGHRVVEHQAVGVVGADAREGERRVRRDRLGEVHVQRQTLRQQRAAAGLGLQGVGVHQ